MILKSGPLQVELIRQREKHIFHVKGEKDWQIKYTTIKEHPLSHDHFYDEDAVATVDIGYDNKELEVSTTNVLTYYALIHILMEDSYLGCSGSKHLTIG